MEEVDKIILDSLKNIDCDTGDITSLKEFDSELTVLAIASCLEAILQEVQLPKKLPPSISGRMTMASVLSDHIKNLGFHGDMGYSTVLYGSELEIRKILMFLIERLPRDLSKTSIGVETSYVHSLLKEIDQNVQLHMKHLWIPSNLLCKGVRSHSGNKFSVHSFGNSVPLISEHLIIPDTRVQQEDVKEYCRQIIPEVTKQCSTNRLIPSLLFPSCQFPSNFNLTEQLSVEEHNVKNEEDTNIERVLKLNPVTVTSDNDINTHQDNELEKLTNEVHSLKQNYIALKEAVKDVQLEMVKIEMVNDEEQLKLKDTLDKVKLKSKTAAVMRNQENVGKLKNLVKSANERFANLSLQWRQVKDPLLEEYESLKNTLSIKESKYQEEQNKLLKLRETHSKLNKDMKEKNVLEAALAQKCQQFPNTEKRSAYTRRIYEIIGNINKQNNEIQKILKDTRALQKEIKILTEQIDRSFTLADELLFHDAKQEDTARRSYKLLVALRDEFNITLKAVSDVGQIEREIRNLQEQIDSENAKEIGVKLERVEADLLQIQKETQSLMKYSQG